MSSKELIIGLGGVGGQAIHDIRRELQTRMRYIEEGTLFRFLYLDRDADAIDRATHTELRQSECILLHTEETTCEQAAHQHGGLRDLRHRLACQKHQISSSIHEIFAEFRKYGIPDDELNIHIFCSPGGITGSGYLIDLITLLHGTGKDMGLGLNIEVYCFVAGSKEHSAPHISFSVNEYTTLRDLNALMTGQYHPDESTGESADELPDTAIRRVFLSSDFDLPQHCDLRQQVAATVGGFLNMVERCRHQPIPNRGKHSDSKLIQSVPQEGTEGKPRLSRRFAAISSRHWVLPKEEIREYLKVSLESEFMRFLLHGTPLPAGGEQREIPQLTAASFDLRASAAYAALRRQQEELSAPLTHTLQDLLSLGKYDEGALEKLRSVSDTIVESIRAGAEKPTLEATFESACRQDLLTFFKKHLKGVLAHPLPAECCPHECWGLNDILRFLRCHEQLLTEQFCTILSVANGETEADADLVSRMQMREKEWRELGFMARLFTKKREKMLSAQVEDAEKRIGGAYRDLCNIIRDSVSSTIQGRLHQLMSELRVIIRTLQEKRVAKEGKARELEWELTAGGNGVNSYALPEGSIPFLKKQLRETTVTPSPQRIFGAFASWLTEDSEKGGGPLTALPEKILRYVDELAQEAQTQLCQEKPIKTFLDMQLLDYLSSGASAIESAKLLGEGWLTSGLDYFPRREISAFVERIHCPLNLGYGDKLPPQLRTSPTARLSILLPRQGSFSPFREGLLELLKDKLHERFQVPHEHMDAYLHDADEIRVVYTPCGFSATEAVVVKHLHAIYQELSAPLFTDNANDKAVTASETRPVDRAPAE